MVVLVIELKGKNKILELIAAHHIVNTSSKIINDNDQNLKQPR